MMETDRQLQGTAQNAANQANTVGSQYGSEAQSLQASLIPTLQKEAEGNMGLTPQQKSQMLSAAEQGGGGAAGSIVGQAGLQAARTHNSAALSGIQDAAARAKTQSASQANLGIENESTQLANARQQAGIEGLTGLYGTNVRGQLGAMGLIPSDVNSGVNAGNSGWLQNAEGVINTVANAGKNVAGAMYGGNSGFANQ